MRITLEGAALSDLLRVLKHVHESGRGVYRVRVATDGKDTVKWKINEDMWSRPYNVEQEPS